jgi:starch synthase
MKILFAASEAYPFVSSGGMADVVGSLPQSLKRKNIDCRIVLPLYSSLSDKLRKKLHFITSFDIPVAWRREHCGIFETEHDGVVYYFIDNEKYFKRDSLYDEYDNAERYAFFSRAVLEFLPRIGFRPDIINSNDWQTALVPIYQHLYYSKNDWYKGIKMVITVHNIAFQGKYGFEVFNDVLGLPDSAVSLVEHDACVNILKGAMQTAHNIVTVSPNYAKEISGFHWDTTGYDFGHGLTQFLSAQSRKLRGILNGVDVNRMNPAKDKNLYANYSPSTYKRGKKKNKAMLQDRLGLEQNPGAPMIGFVTRIDSRQKGCQIVLEALNTDLLHLYDAQFVVLGNAAAGDAEGRWLEEGFRELERRNRGRVVSYIGYIPELAQKIYAASDIYLMPSKYEPCGLSQIIALKYGAIPIVRETGGLVDTVKDISIEGGNGFTFCHYSGGELYQAIERALRCYKDGESWDALVKRAIGCDFSWDSDATEEYSRFYRELLHS